MSIRIEYKENDPVGNCFYVKETDPYIWKGNPMRRAYFRCKCGNVFIATLSNVRGHTKSCGCRIGRYPTPGKRKINEAEYLAYHSMKDRCLNANNKAYKYYGGRGIKICDRWLESYTNFLEDMGKRPTKKHSLDRWPDKNGNYEISNCRWATKIEQANNKRNNNKVLYNGEELSISELARKVGMHRGKLANRLKLGVSVEVALSAKNYEIRGKIPELFKAGD